MIYKKKDGTYAVYDWKRSKEISMINNYNKFAKNKLICHMPDSNFWHYALQLNTYKAILEEKYGKTVTKLALVCLHPDKTNFQVIPVPILQDEMKALMALRKGQVQV